MDKRCIVCNSTLDLWQHNEVDEVIQVNCPVCGKYAFSTRDYLNRQGIASIPGDEIAAFLYHKNKMLENERPDDYVTFVGDEEHFGEISSNYPSFHFVSTDVVRSFRPRKFADRIDYSLLAISRLSRFYGEELVLSKDEVKSLLFMTRYDENGTELDPSCINMQYDAIKEYLSINNYVKLGEGYKVIFVTLLFDGWKRIDNIQQNSNDNKNIFVSMSFADSARQTREAIRKGIIEAGFSPEFMDEIIHNRQIVPEMFRLIRECRLLILDISEPNYGAYYEAGYALGLGKEVIISCSSETYNRRYVTDEEKKYERYLKPHFDIAQNQILIWDNEEDFIKKLSEWIKALIR